MHIGLFDNFNNTVVVFLSFDHSRKSTSCQFLVKLIFLLSQINSSVRSKVLFILGDQILQILQGFTALYSTSHLWAYYLYLTSHSSKEFLNLLYHVGFYVFRIDFSNIAKAVLVGFVFSVKFTLEIASNQGSEQMLGLFRVFAFDYLKLKKALIAHLLPWCHFISDFVRSMLLANFNFRVLVHHFELCWPSSCHLFLGSLYGGLWFNHFRSLACDWCLNSLDVVFHNLILSFRVLILIT